MKLSLAACALSCTLASAAFSQVPAMNPVYLDTSVATIRITIDADSLALIYLRDSLESDYEYPAQFTFDNGVIRDSIPEIGFRLRGNTSRQSVKKSFKVSFNTFVSGRTFHGLEKLNLNGEHNDPSIVRAKLAWDLFNGSGAAAPRASHARVFINNQYYGLYISVEHIDENFVLSRFGNNTGNLYKCLWPADLNYRGSSPANYSSFMSGDRLVYELKTNTDQWDYSDLADFITFLKNSSDPVFLSEIETRINVPGLLRNLAVDVAVGSWDDYWFLKNNFYLYHNQATGRFEFIPYDYDNTFGIWWTSIMAGRDWGTQNIYAWGNPLEPRPLITRLLNQDRYRRWFSYFLNKLLQEQFDPVLLTPRVNALHTMITPAAEADTYRTLDYGYTVQQFHSSYTTALGAHVTYGLLPYIATRRTSALQQLQLLDIAPIILSQFCVWRGADSVRVSARVEDNAPGVTVTVTALPDQGSPVTVPLWDDGLHGDGGAGDGMFAGTIARPESGKEMKYYLRAQDGTGNLSLDPSNAPASFWRVAGTSTAGPLVINEFMASNTATIADPSGDHDDWVEIGNASAQPVPLRGKFLTDNLSIPNKWALPDTTLPPGGYALVWTDGEPAEGRFHATWKLDKAGEQLGIFDSTAGGFIVMDSLTFGLQTNDVSVGRFPDLSGGLTPMVQPTPGKGNVLTDVTGTAPGIPGAVALFPAYPNPFNPRTTIVVQLPDARLVTLRVYDLLGREVATLVNSVLPAGVHRFAWDATNVAGGAYMCRMTAGGKTETVKVLLIK